MMRRGRTPSLLIANVVLREIIAGRFSGLGRLERDPKIFGSFLDTFRAICVNGANLVLGNVPADMSFALLCIKMLAGFTSFEVNVFVVDW